jgi:hypothetical protein
MEAPTSRLRVNATRIMDPRVAKSVPRARIAMPSPEATEDDEHVERVNRLAKLLETLRERTHDLLRRLERGRPHPLALPGHILSTPDRPTTTIEIVIDQDVYWQPPDKAILPSGAVAVVERGTTRGGAVSAGSIVRVEIMAPADHVARSGRVEIQNGDVRLVVTLAYAD